MDIYAMNIFIEHFGEHWWEQNFFFRSPQAFWQSSAPGVLSTLVTSVILYSLTRATLMSPRQDETRVCGYLRSEYIHWALWRTLMRTKFFCSLTTSFLAKLSTRYFEHSGDISCFLPVNPSHTDESWAGWNTCMWIYTYIYLYISSSKPLL